MEDEVQLSGVARGGWVEAEGYAAADMQRERTEHRAGECAQQPCARTGECAEPSVTGENGAVSQGQKLVSTVTGVSGAEEAILGQPFVGARLFLLHGRGCDRRNGQTLY